MEKENWYIAYTYPKAEKKVRDRLEDLGFEPFLPLTRVKRQWSDRIKIIEQPLFNNYIFVRTTLKKLSKLLSMNGIVKFISFAGEYATIREEEIEVIKKIVAYGRNVEVEYTGFEEGQLVMINNGPLAGIEGTLKTRKGKKRFIVEIDGIDGKISMSIQEESLRRVRRNILYL